jgi:hypothetical protein
MNLNKQMKFYMRSLFLIFVLLMSPLTLLQACEPATFDFGLFLKTNDKNKDTYLQKDELLSADNSISYGTYLDKPITTAEAFIELDANKDKKLSSEELWQWGQYTHDGCENFNMHAGKNSAPGFFERIINWLVNLFS